MKIVHGIWVPATAGNFYQSGHFAVWIETDEVPNRLNKDIHPQKL